MRIAGAHHGAAIFKYLNVIDLFQSAEFAELILPHVHDLFDVWQLHGRQSEIVTWRKADDPAYSGLAFGHDQPSSVNIDTCALRIRLQSGKIIFEDERRRVRRIMDTAGA